MTYRRYDIYIGSENSSHKISRDYLSKITEWANSAFPDGYTLFSGTGYWDGYSEDCILISALTPYEHRSTEHLKRLKDKLGQRAILLSKYEVDVEVI